MPTHTYYTKGLYELQEHKTLIIINKLKYVQQFYPPFSPKGTKIQCKMQDQKKKEFLAWAPVLGGGREGALITTHY